MGSEQREWGRVFEILEDTGLENLPDERYSIKKEIGRGGAKVVYRAVDNNSGREVAYVIPINNQKADLFLREARITAYLQHPNILPVYDVSGEDHPFFVCKLLRGKTLSKIRPKGYSQDQLLAYFRKICEAMEYAHSRGVLHLDLKPDNVRLDKFGEVLLFDWGLAEIFCTESIESPLDNPLISGNESYAKDYTSLGTPGYMSPEQIEGKKVDVRTDIFSLGALLYFIFHRKAPFKGKSIDDIFDKTVYGKNEKIKSDLSSSLSSIISKCLSVNPTDRYSQVSDLIADLDALEKNYVPVAENANFIKHFSLLYKRNKLICNLLVIFLLVLAVINTRYIKELNVSKQEAVSAKNKAEKYLLDVLEEQERNQKLTRALSPRYYLEAKNYWDFYQIPEAMKNCDFALKLNPKNKDALELKAQLLFVTGKYVESDRIWAKLQGA
ncbi:MAG: protein kinase, partial [Lentisphaeraceae bacterium]|nr:protein kinase [Lentisphaeraceae bacterium]